MDSEDVSYRSSSVTSSFASRNSSRYYTKRRQVGDKVLVTSNSSIYMNPSIDQTTSVSTSLVPRYNGYNCDKIDFALAGESIRNSKDLPKIRNKIFEESLESQEITFYVDDYCEAVSQYDFNSFESDNESDSKSSPDRSQTVQLRRSQHDVPLPEPPNNESNYGLVKLAENVKKFRKNLTRDLSKSIRRISQRMTIVNIETRDPYKEELPAPIHHVKISDSEARNDSQYKSGSPSILKRIRSRMSLSADSGLNVAWNSDNQRKSVFYITSEIFPDAIDIDYDGAPSTNGHENGVMERVSPVPSLRKVKHIRPRMPPPPTPVEDNAQQPSTPSNDRTSASNTAAEAEINTNVRQRGSWYAEFGRYAKTTDDPMQTRKSMSFGSVIEELSAKLNIIHDEYDRKAEGETTYRDLSVKSFKSSSSNDDSSYSTYYNIHFLDEPLYQFYDAAKLESLGSDDLSDFETEDVYEDVDQPNENYIPTGPFLPTGTNVSRKTHFPKSLWCELPEVQKSSVLSQLSTLQKKLQEAKFEMITSEASYFNSLNVLIDHFVPYFKKSDLINEREIEILFGKIKDVRNSSSKILQELEKCWQNNILLDGICDIVQRHAEENFFVYIPYCENQVVLNETLTQMKEQPDFLDFLRQIESSNSCQFLTLYSFLMLPMQRITRWPLLVDAVMKRLSESDPEYLTCRYALTTLNKIVSQCNEAARKKERELELHRISKSLEFSKWVPHIDIITEDRWLIRSGSMVSLQTRNNDDLKMTLRKRFNKVPLHLFLFNDLFVATKKRGEANFTVQHYCPRNLIVLRSVDMFPAILKKDAQTKNLLYLSVLENQEGKSVELLLWCSTETDKERWMEAFAPPKSENADETLYEAWDCPQVTALHNYNGCQPDELSLSRGDIINVLRKMSDGWYHGERIRDGQTGWFPGSYTEEIKNRHVRARNLKQRDRLLTFSQNYLKP